MIKAYTLFCFATLFVLGADRTNAAQPVRTEVAGVVKGVEHVFLFEPLKPDGSKLLPDTCFFSGESKKSLRLSGAAKADDPGQLNGGNTYDIIEGLEDPDQRVVWPLLLKTPGAITGKIIARGTGRLIVKLGTQQTTVNVTSNAAAFTIQNSGVGQTELCVSPETFKGSLERIELSGPGLRDGRLLRARWRPAAIHAGFTASTLGKENSRLWVMEVRPVPSEKSFYSPITTPFGYFGSTFNPDGTCGGINFSMWSYARGKAEPPIAQLSHLTAVGSPQATFGGFGHEGTGVKPRDWNPYEGRKVASAALALRIDPGVPYDTYTGYFYDEPSQSWRLYASGRKWSGRGSKENLLPGCFVEVPGPPNIERTGHIVRAADLRGWCRDAKGTWHTFDTMNGSGADAAREQTNCLWSSSEDGWFRMAMGGMTHFRYDEAIKVHIGKFKVQPAFLTAEKLRVLDQLPSTIRVLSAIRRGNGLDIEVELAGSYVAPSAIKAFVGKTDALSFAERWDTTVALGSIKPGRTRLNIPKAPTAGSLRLQISNEAGIFVSTDATTWN